MSSLSTHVLGTIDSLEDLTTPLEASAIDEQPSPHELRGVALEMDRCAILHDENDGDPENEDETMQPSSIFLSHTTPQQVTTTSPFEIFIVNQLCSINRKLYCMDRSHTDIKTQVEQNDPYTIDYGEILPVNGFRLVR